MVSVHNSHIYLRVMAEMREHLAAGTFAAFREDFVGNYVPTRRVLTGRLQVERER
jgi:queuine/archaeosine tRNA-ribosyltransferase